MALTALTSVEQFEGAIRSPDVSVVHFCAEWAAQCAPMNKVLQTEADNFKAAKFFTLEAEEMPEIAHKYEVTAVPTFLLFRAGAVVAKINGADATKLTMKIKEVLSSGAAPSSENLVSEKPDLNSRLTRLTNAAPVMLFMKGNATEPKCGFSKQIVAILDEMQAEYKTFDILGDEEVRQGLKTFSNWPTFPQLYVKGELIGGLDIVKEMKESGDLEPLLPKKIKLEDRLKALINKHPVMIFMKGNRKEPKCGFSKTLIEIMEKLSVEYDTFDILQDEEVRQGLKTFSNWPTYPQVYAKGELLGGLDIIKEMQESGELLEALKS